MSYSQPISAFSDAAILYMFRSDLFCPSAYKTAEGESIDDIYANREKKHRGHLVILPFRYAAQLAYLVGVDLLVVPAGVVYNAWQGYVHPEKREACFEAVIKDARLTGPLVAGVISVTSSIFFSRLGIFVQIGGLGVLLLGYHVWSVIKPLVDPVGVLRELSEGSSLEEWFTRWEFNRTNTEEITLERCLKNRTEKLISLINRLQSALPREMKMPAYEYPLRIPVLDWLEDKKEDLKKEGVWASIRPLKNDFARVSSELESAARYGDISKWQEEYGAEIALAFALREGESALHINTRQRDSVAGAFSLALFKKMCGSNLFFPSEYELRETDASLSDTLEKTNPFEARKKITHWKWKRQCAGLARSFAFVAIGVIGVPTGMLYHAAQGLGWGAYSLFQKETHQHRSWEKTMAHVSALWVDASYLLTGGHTLSLKFLNVNNWVNNGGYAKLALLILGGAAKMAYVTPLRTILVTVLASSLASSILLSAFTAVWSPESLIASFAYRDERSALFKALAMRQQCGVVATGGGLLPYHKGIHQSPVSVYDEGLHQLWIKNGMETLVVLKQVNESLSVPQKEAFRKIVVEQGIAYHPILELLSGEEYKNLKEKLEGSKQTMTELRELIEECYRIQHHDVRQNKLYIFQGLDFPFLQKDIENFLVSVQSSQTALPRSLDPYWSKWEQRIRIERQPWRLNTLTDEKRTNQRAELVTRSQAVSPDYSGRAEALFDLINAENIPTPWEILGLSEGSDQQAINRQWKKDSRLLHPDRVGKANETDATLFFRVVTEAKECALHPHRA